MAQIKRPLDGLNEAKGKRVILELKNKKRIVGKLLAFDVHPNMVLEDAEEHENGEMKRKLGKIFIRGDMIVTVLLQ